MKVHSIRKYFKTQLLALGVRSDYVDYMMGHTIDTYRGIQMKGVESIPHRTIVGPEDQENKQIKILFNALKTEMKKELRPNRMVRIHLQRSKSLRPHFIKISF